MSKANTLIRWGWVSNGIVQCDTFPNPTAAIEAMSKRIGCDWEPHRCPTIVLAMVEVSFKVTQVLTPIEVLK